MDVNYEVWGNPEDWRDASSYTYYGLGDFKRPKEGVNSYYNAYDNGSLVGGEVPTDLSLAFWGIGKGSILTKPMFLASYWDGDTIKTVAEPINDEEKSSVPCILGYASDGEGQYSLSWWNRYAPADNPGEAEWSTSNVINIWSMYREIFTAFNYQKVMLVPFVRVALGSPTSGWNETYVSLKQYIDGMVTGGAYANYNKILAIGYQLAVGEGGDDNRSTGNKELSINIPVNIKGSSRHWEGVKSNRQRDWLWFATEYGINTMLDSGMLNPGSYSYARSITPYRRLGAVDFSSLHNIGDGETGLCYKYCENYKEPSDTGYGQVPIPYYYDPDDEIWKINDSQPWNTNVADPFPYIECTTANKNVVRDYILGQIAYLGFPFVYDPSMATRGKIGDIGVYLPVFDDNGITTGEYKEGTAALELPNAEWVDGREGSGYDPTKPDGGGGDEDEGITVRPSTPSFTLAGHGTKCYALVESDIDEIFDDIYGRSSSSWSKLIKGLEMFGADPMGAIISFKWYPYSFSSTTNSAVYLGNTAINPLHQYPVIDSTANSCKSTTATYKWDVARNFVNSRKTTCRLYLPFYGFYELPLPLIISKTLSVYMSYNVPDELATWVISFDDVIYDFVECDPSIDIPLTGSNAAQIALTKRNTALSIATQVGATAAAIAVGATMQAPALGAAVGELGAIYSGAGTIGGVIQSLPWLEASSARALAAGGAAAAGIGAGGVASGANILNRISNAKMQIGHLMTNLPYHGAASSTTFLNLPMYPYIQFIQNVKMQGWNEAEYKIKVGIACDKWVTTNSMPANSLLQTTGIANMDVNDLELAEVQELNEILQSGFCK